MKRFHQFAPWFILSLPFLILAYSYTSLPNEVVITRDLFGDGVFVAPKSVFTVFRVPLIEVVCAAAVEIMRRRSSDPNAKTDSGQYSFWTILLYTVALKSSMQAIEAVSPKVFENTAFYLTVAIVVTGILAAAVTGRKLFFGLKEARTKLGRLEALALISLLIAYIGLAFVSVSYLD